MIFISILICDYHSFWRNSLLNLHQKQAFFLMKTILVPTDFSPLSLQALDVAVQLAKPRQAEVILLHCAEFAMQIVAGDGIFPSTTTQYNADYVQSVVDASTERLEKLVKSLKYKGVIIRPVVENNFDGIERTIVKSKADLIVMASTGAKGWKEALWGSHAEGVVRQAKSPVLIVKKSTKELKLKKVLFATDFRQTKFVKSTMDLLELTDMNCWLHFVCVNTPLNFNGTKSINGEMEKLAKKLKLLNYQFVIYNAFSEEQGILDYAEAIGADLIVLPTHGRKGLSHVMYGSIAEDVVNHAKFPIMTMIE